VTINVGRCLAAVTVAASLTAALSAAPAVTAAASAPTMAGGYAVTSGHTIATGLARPSLRGQADWGNPFLEPGGLGSVHNDSESSNTTPQPGPGAGAVNSSLAYSGTVCPAILAEQSGLLAAYCLHSTYPTFQPVLELLDPQTLAVLASFSLPPTGPFSEYPYLDQAGRIVVATGTGHILRIAAGQNSAGQWQLSVVNDWDISQAVLGHCGGGMLCDYVVSVKPDWVGRIWFATNGGVVGTLNPFTGIVQTTMLPAGEQVSKALSTSRAGVAVVSDHALYLLAQPDNSAPRILWREPYARGTGVKLGQETDGSGTSPTFFGAFGDQYVTIIDNAVPQEDLLVFRVGWRSGSRLVCSEPVFTPGASATENTSIAIGDTIIASSTAGYNFQDPTSPVPLPGGLTRIDVAPDGTGCNVVWASTLPSDAVPKLSLGDGYLYTFDRTVADGIASYGFDVIDPATGGVVSEHNAGSGPAYETLQLPPMIAPDGTVYESTVAGILSVRRAAGNVRTF
jgi:hypothetical protein